MGTTQRQPEDKPIDLLRDPAYWTEKGRKAGRKLANELINKMVNELVNEIASKVDKRCQNVIT